jgi:hypothetical protein
MPMISFRRVRLSVPRSIIAIFAAAAVFPHGEQGVLACLGNPDPVDMKVYCPMGKETFDDDETTEEAPSRGGRCQAARR